MKLALLGFGNVLRAFVELLSEKAPLIEKKYRIPFSVVGIATRSHGLTIDPDGLDLQAVLQTDKLDKLNRFSPVNDVFEFIRICPAEMILEATWLDPQIGQPALDYVRTALESGKHVVTANKGPVAFGYHDLQNLAAAKNLGFFFESTVMDGMPIQVLKREGLLAAEVTRIRGVLNSTTNYILNRLEEGISFEDAIKQAQDMGVAETDPANDIDGWDAAIKITILANIFMGGDLRPQDVDRTGIRQISASQAQAARREGCPIKLICQAEREGDHIHASVKPIQVEANDPMGDLKDTASAITFETDILKQITVIEGPAGPRATAYGMLVDAINIARGRRWGVL